LQDRNEFYKIFRTINHLQEAMSKEQGSGTTFFESCPHRRYAVIPLRGDATAQQVGDCVTLKAGVCKQDK
jgi:hypothetical protein